MAANNSTIIVQLLQKIALDYDLDLDELKHRYVLDSMFVKNQNTLETTKTSSLICMARKQDGTQCTRRKKQDCDYCGKHVTNRRYGRIDDCNSQEKSNCIQTRLEIINGTNYLVDNLGMVFTYNTNKPEVIGYKENGELITVN